MIVKIQISLASSDGVRYALIYDRSREIYYETDKPEEVKPLVKLLGKRPKAYFNAFIDKDGKIQVKEEAPTQKNW